MDDGSLGDHAVQDLMAAGPSDDKDDGALFEMVQDLMEILLV